MTALAGFAAPASRAKSPTATVLDLLPEPFVLACAPPRYVGINNCQRFDRQGLGDPDGASALVELEHTPGPVGQSHPEDAGRPTKITVKSGWILGVDQHRFRRIDRGGHSRRAHELEDVRLLFESLEPCS
jgi:hypothetical protein